jgi:hypothetical protein
VSKKLREVKLRTDLALCRTVRGPRRILYRIVCGQSKEQEASDSEDTEETKNSTDLVNNTHCITPKITSLHRIILCGTLPLSTSLCYNAPGTIKGLCPDSAHRSPHNAFSTSSLGNFSTGFEFEYLGT